MNNENKLIVEKTVDKPQEKAAEMPHVSRKFAIIVISIFVAMLLLPTVLWGVLKIVSIGNPSLMEAIDFDTGENRAFAKFPDKFDPQTFTSEVEAWYNDHLPFRSVLYKTQNNIENALETPYTETVRPMLIKIFHSGGNQPTPGPGNEVIEIPDPTEAVTEGVTETLPQFEIETEEGTDSTCAHVLSSESVVIKEATCTEYGIIGYPCINCDYVGKKEYSHKLPHSYVSDIADNQVFVCGTNYKETLTCSACGDVKTQLSVKTHTPGKKLAVNQPSYLDYGYTLIECKDCKTQYRTNLSNKLYNTEYFPPIYHSNDGYEGRYQWLFYRGNNSIAYYEATNLASDIELQNYASILQTLNDICKEKGIQLQISIWPNKEQVYSEYTPTMNVVSEYKRVERIVDYITENTDVTMIYPINELLTAKPYWELYWPLDTHWNNAGAFIGYQAMLKSLGLETTSLVNLPIRELRYTDSDYSSIVYNSNSSLLYAPKGDLQGLCGVTGYPQQKNYIVTYRPDVHVLSVEGNNGAGDTRHSTSDGPNDLNFVMLADSYRVMQLTYLEKDFTDCFLSHRDRVMEPDVVEAVKNADILVIAAVERLETNIVDTAKRLISILSSAE